jgi:hypothetical protein
MATKLTHCSACPSATPISYRFGLYLCIFTGRLKHALDPCDVNTTSPAS